MFAPGLPVAGSIGVRVLPALLLTHSVLRSNDGTTCCAIAPVANLSITLYVVGSITHTSADSLWGTYTRFRAFAAAGARPEVAAA
jgi:hypothetical protein